jgi:hypothetical protein
MSDLELDLRPVYGQDGETSIMLYGTHVNMSDRRDTTLPDLGDVG